MLTLVPQAVNVCGISSQLFDQSLMTMCEGKGEEACHTVRQEGGENILRDVQLLLCCWHLHNLQTAGHQTFEVPGSHCCLSLQCEGSVSSCVFSIWIFKVFFLLYVCFIASHLVGTLKQIERMIKDGELVCLLLLPPPPPHPSPGSQMEIQTSECIHSKQTYCYQLGICFSWDYDLCTCLAFYAYRSRIVIRHMHGSTLNCGSLGAYVFLKVLQPLPLFQNIFHQPRKQL